MSTEPLRLTEPVPIDDDLCTGLAMVEEAGVGLRLVLYAAQTCYETGETTNVVKRKIVLPAEAVMPAIEMTIGYMTRRMAALAGLRLSIAE